MKVFKPLTRPKSAKLFRRVLLAPRQEQGAFDAATSPEHGRRHPKTTRRRERRLHLEAPESEEIRRYQGFTEDDELYIHRSFSFLATGRSRPTTKKVAEALKKEIEPLKVLGILRRDIPTLFFQPTRAQQTRTTPQPA